MRAYFTDEQRTAIKQAASEWPDVVERGGDVVDYATESGNYFYTGLDDHSCRVALRYMSIVCAAELAFRNYVKRNPAGEAARLNSELHPDTPEWTI